MLSKFTEHETAILAISQKSIDLDNGKENRQISVEIKKSKDKSCTCWK